MDVCTADIYDEIKQGTKHVVIFHQGFSDGGSIPPTSTLRSLRELRVASHSPLLKKF